MHKMTEILPTEISLKTKAVVLEFGRFQLECEPDTGLTAWKKSGLIELEEIIIWDESDHIYHKL